MEIHCVYLSNPPAKAVRWYRGEKNQIEENKKYHISGDMHNHKQHTKLLINNVNKNDLTDYHCEIEVRTIYWVDIPN